MNGEEYREDKRGKSGEGRAGQGKEERVKERGRRREKIGGKDKRREEGDKSKEKRRMGNPGSPGRGKKVMRMTEKEEEDPY